MRARAGIVLLVAGLSSCRPSAPEPAAQPTSLATGAITRGTVAGAPGTARLGEDGFITIDRNIAVERLANRAEGLEQSWAFASRPSGEGDLEIRVAVGGQTFRGE